MESKMIEPAQMERAFQQLSTVINLTDMYEKEGKELQYQKYLSEQCGVLCVFFALGIQDEWFAWRAEQMKKEEK